MIIAAAGNSEGGSAGVKYPAAYPEVIAVGSVNSEGEASSFSPSGSQIELVAPGELVTSTDIFNTLSTHSGTSYAAPYVTAIASKLWEQDLDCSRDFIRAVLAISANLYGEQQSYGYGLVDYEYANKIFPALKPLAKGNHDFNTIVDYAVNVRKLLNTSDIPVMNTTDELVEGAWLPSAHEGALGSFSLASENEKKLIISGCRLPDSPTTMLNGMTGNPYFHGYCYYKENGVALEDSNYIAGGLYLTKIAKRMLSGKVYSTASGYVDRQYHQLSTMIDNDFINLRDGVTWSDVDSKIQYYTGATFNPDNARHRAMVIYGMALHTFADTFAHSAIYNGDLIKHVTIGEYEKAADNVNFIPERYKAASLVCQKALKQICNYTYCDISIFDLSGTGYENSVKLLYFNHYADIVCNRSQLFVNDNTYSSYFALLDAGISL